MALRRRRCQCLFKQQATRLQLLYAARDRQNDKTRAPPPPPQTTPRGGAPGAFSFGCKGRTYEVQDHEIDPSDSCSTTGAEAALILCLLVMPILVGTDLPVITDELQGD